MGPAYALNHDLLTNITYSCYAGFSVEPDRGSITLGHSQNHNLSGFGEGPQVLYSYAYFLEKAHTYGLKLSGYGAGDDYALLLVLALVAFHYVLKMDAFRDWIQTDVSIDHRKEIISTKIHTAFTFHPVSKAVNSAKEHTADLIEGL